jgi:peptide/nickel transport system ATP-binding protein
VGVGAPALVFEHVSVDYSRGGTSVRAVRDVSLSIAEGEIVGLVGESGSGKSTLGRCALGLLPAAQGRVAVLGHPVRAATVLSGADKAVRAQIGVIFQDPGSSLDPRMTIAQAIAEPLRIHGGNLDSAKGGRKAERRRVLELLDAVELPAAYAQRYPHELSGGQRQRVGLARAIVLNPRVLIADEPTSALDVSVQAHVLSALRNLQAAFDFACLFISHDLAVIHEVSHRVAVMWQGAVIEVGDTSSILVRPSHPYTIRLLAAVPSPDPREQERRRAARMTLATLAAGGAGQAPIQSVGQ